MDLPPSDSDDSGFFITPTQKRKAGNKINSKKSKQLKLACRKDETKSLTKNGIRCTNENVTPSEQSPTSEENVKSLCKDGFDISESDTNSPGVSKEATSTIFALRPASRQIKLSCPMCLKIFDNNNAHVSHMKQCAKKRKMTTTQLLSAVELHKKQQEERRTLGLSQIPSSDERKIHQPKKCEAPDDPETNFELAMALAMSRSLANAEAKCDSSSSTVIEAQKVTLEKFGFTSSAQSFAGKKRMKGSRLSRTILKERTEEERERLMTEKAAAVLLDENMTAECPKNSLEKLQVTVHSSELHKYKVDAPQLWQLSENENAKEKSWYVEEIKHLIATDKATPSAHSVSPGTLIPTSEDLPIDVAALNLPTKNLEQDWKKLVNSETMSDLSARTRDDKTVHLHSLVLYVRCPELLSSDLKSILNRHDYTTIIPFLEFLYVGVFSSLTRTQLENLLCLARTLKYRQLIEVVTIAKENLTAMTNTSSEGIIPSSLPSNEGDFAVVEPEGAEDKDMVDLTQSSPGSPTENINNELSDEDSQLNESYWSFLEHEKKKDAMEELWKQEEEKENIIDSLEMRKIESIMKQQKEMNQLHKDKLQREDDEVNLKNKLELEKIYRLSMKNCSSEDKDLFEDEPKMNSDVDLFEEAKPKPKPKPKPMTDCIVISSDSEGGNDEEDTQKLFEKTKPDVNMSFEIPYFDPYEHFNSDFIPSPPETKEIQPSQSLIMRDFSPLSTRFMKQETSEVPRVFPKKEENPNSPPSTSANSSPPKLETPKKSVVIETPKKSVVIETPKKSVVIETPKKSVVIETPKKSVVIETPKKSVVAETPKTSVVVETPSSPTPAEAAKTCPPSQEGPAYCSTPLTARKVRSDRSGKIESVTKTSAEKSRKRKSDVGMRRAVTNYSRLSLKSKPLKKNLISRRSTRNSRSSSKKSKNDSEIVAQVLTSSIVNEFNNTLAASFGGDAAASPLPSHNGRFVEITPRPSPGVEYVDKASPLPDYSAMEATILKKHLGRYGLKKSLSRSKAKKILRHIYEELHPRLNTKTGKIVKLVPGEKLKRSEKTTGSGRKVGRPKKTVNKRQPKLLSVNDGPKEEGDKTVTAVAEKSAICGELNMSTDSVERSTDCDSEGSEFDLEDRLTQSSSATEVDISTAVCDFLRTCPGTHRDILLYEPIWLEKLQGQLLLSCNKKFKLSELMDFLDKMCITFRSEAQKKNNVKRNEKKKSSPSKRQKSPKK